MAAEGRYDFREAETRLQDQWSARKVYEVDPATDGPIFSVDTPPPTVSGQIAQRGFLDLHARGLVRRREAPTLWCRECRTAVAQADVEDKADVPASFVTLRFPTTDGRTIPIATTRPELLAGCVAVFVHPDDPRYAYVVGATAITTLSGQQWPALTDSQAKTEEYPGAGRYATFGHIADCGSC